MTRTIDVRTEINKLAASKPVHAAAGAGMLISETLRELPARLTKLRNENPAHSLSTRANGYVTTARTRASREYDRLAERGEKALNGRRTGSGQRALNGRRTHRSRSQGGSSTEA
jgi:hypothetical protein